MGEPIDAAPPVVAPAPSSPPRQPPTAPAREAEEEEAPSTEVAAWGNGGNGEEAPLSVNAVELSGGNDTTS